MSISLVILFLNLVPNLFSPELLRKYASEVRPSEEEGQLRPTGVTSGNSPFNVPQVEPQNTSLLKREGSLPFGYKAALIGSQLFDGATTRYALSNNKNAVESNPFLGNLSQNTPAFLGAKGLIGALSSHAMSEMAKEHPTKARLLSLGLSALPTALGVSNLIKSR